MSSSCSDGIKDTFSTQEKFNPWKQGIDTQLNSIPSSSLITEDHKSRINVIEQEVYSVLGCMEEQMADTRTSTNDIQGAQASILATEQAIKDAEDQIKIAKDRVAYTRDPDTHPSFYQSWFPMDRPMKPISIPIFIGLITFFGVIITLLLLSYFGINVSATFPLPQPSYGSPSMLSLLFAQITPVTAIAIAALIGVVIYFRRRN